MTGKLVAVFRVVLSRLVTFVDSSCFGRSFLVTIRRVDSRLLVLSRLAMCRFGLAVVIGYFGY